MIVSSKAEGITRRFLLSGDVDAISLKTDGPASLYKSGSPMNIW